VGKKQTIAANKDSADLKQSHSKAKQEDKRNREKNAVPTNAEAHKPKNL